MLLMNKHIHFDTLASSEPSNTADGRESLVSTHSVPAGFLSTKIAIYADKSWHAACFLPLARNAKGCVVKSKRRKKEKKANQKKVLHPT